MREGQNSSVKIQKRRGRIDFSCVGREWGGNIDTLSAAACQSGRCTQKKIFFPSPFPMARGFPSGWGEL